MEDCDSMNKVVLTDISALVGFLCKKNYLRLFSLNIHFRIQQFLCQLLI